MLYALLFGRSKLSLFSVCQIDEILVRFDDNKKISFVPACKAADYPAGDCFHISVPLLNDCGHGKNYRTLGRDCD